MTQEEEEKPEDEMSESVRLRRERIDRWEKAGERTLIENLSLIGSLGWLVVAPAVLGILAGRWLDKTFDMGVFWTATFLFLGIVAGSWMAWQRIDKE